MSEIEIAIAENQASAEKIPGLQADSAPLASAAARRASPTAWPIVLGVLLLAALSALRLYSGWETWGNLSTDSGREIYVSLVVKDGGTLYRDVWYPYGPLAPYVNAVLFRMFGVHLLVPYIGDDLGTGISHFSIPSRTRAGVRLGRVDSWRRGHPAGL